MSKQGKSHCQRVREKGKFWPGNCGKEKEELVGKSLLIFLPEKRDIITEEKIKATVL